MPTFILLMTGIFSFVGLMIWLDYRRLGRHSIKPEEAESFAKSALANWKVSAEQNAASQQTERSARMVRVFAILKRNLKVMLVCDAGIVALFSLLVVIGIIKGNRIDLDYVKGFAWGILYFCGLFSTLLAGITLIVVIDALGWRTLKMHLGFYDYRPVEIALGASGILYVPGGLQRFNYPVRSIEVVPGEVSLVFFHTSRARFSQDFYVPVPKGLEAEAEEAVKRFTRGC